jgi:hypothetical protein
MSSNLLLNEDPELTAALARVDDLVEQRPMYVPDDATLASLISTLAAVANLLEAGETIHLTVSTESGAVVASTPLTLSPA